MLTRGRRPQVTDSRDTPAHSSSRPNPRRTSSPNRPPNAGHGNAPGMVRHVSVDSVLRGTSEIPSGQVRGGNALSYLQRSRVPASSSPSSYRGAPPHPVNPRRVVNQGQTLPSRSSKVSEKLVLIPETEEDEVGRWDYQEEDEDGPLRDDEDDSRLSPEEGDETAGRLPPRKSYAERLPKSRRAEKFSRVTAYCTADAYRLKSASTFLKEAHHARTKLYDECLYVAYHLPLLAGGEGCRLRSSPALKNPGGKPVLDVEIERSEQRNYHEGYFDEEYRGRRDSVEEDREPGNRPSGDCTNNQEESADIERHERPRSPKDSHNAMDMNGIAEMFVFSYGVVVFWNFTERQEKDILADLTFAPGHGSPLISGPMREEDFETEEFHFEYSSKTRSPRVTNFAPTRDV